MAWLTWLLTPYYRIRDHIRFKRRIKELQKRDPFIYK
jgi:hypothetical protein